MSDKEKHNRRNQDEARKKNGKYRLLGVVTACVMVFMSACAGKAEQEKTSANAQQETVPVSGTQRQIFLWRPFQNRWGTVCGD